MSNIHGLHSFRNDNNNNRDNSDSDDDGGTNDRYVGGVDARGGGSGLAVLPNPDDANAASDAIFNLAGPSSGSGGGSSEGGETRRTITMYRSGFTVDNGPYRRLNDQSNAEFLTSLARGMIPRELSQEAAETGSEGEVMVGLVDRRAEEYDPEKHGKERAAGSGDANGGGSQFHSFSGEGQSLGASSASASSAAASTNGVINPTSQVNSTTPSPVDPSRPSTSIAIRLLNGKRLVVKINLDQPVSSLGQHIGSQAGQESYVLTSGFPPRVLEDLGVTVEVAGLKGAQVVLKKA